MWPIWRSSPTFQEPGASDERYLADLKPGNYYVDVNSECGWQIALSPGG